MPEAWYMNDLPDDTKLEHHLDPPHFIPFDQLYPLSRVEYWRINVDDLENDETFNELKKSRGYNWSDVVEISREKLPNYDDTLKAFYTEHLHEDEEIRLFLEGSAYFDVRDKYDKWVRIKAAKGDLLVLPAGIYHRFTPDSNSYAKVMRLFCGTPVWKAIPRPAEDNPARTIYLNTVAA